MSSPSSHTRYEELVVGHALSALEPEDEDVLLRHLPSCAACERELVLHRETLAHLAYAADSEDPPASLWEGIRREVVAESGPDAFPAPAVGIPAPQVSPDPSSESLGQVAGEPSPRVPEQAGGEVVDLQAARSRRVTGRARRPAAWASVAAAVALVATVGIGVGVLRDGRQDGGTDAFASAVRTVMESAPGTTVPLAGKDGKPVAVSVLQDGRVSLIVDRLPANDASSSIYVLWGQTGAEDAVALAAFDADGGIDVLRNVAVTPTGTDMPQLFVITQESGRTAPPVAKGPALATGRAA